ncbi:MAG TPA: 2-C-methyl-D-erythritol 4-phosphate cytidylyltransferase, partial [Thermomicrobiales bacterium]|nr:2-C-methyl-D-erythritol 4-phosphate cytidylyltransferase [Thermomicrobiales bacterium]
MPAQVRAAAVIVAAGQGQRFGAPDKVLLPLAGKPLLTYALGAANAATTIDEIIVVAGAHTLDRVGELLERSAGQKMTTVVAGGERRQDSVAAGIAALPDSV